MIRIFSEMCRERLSRIIVTVLCLLLGTQLIQGQALTRDSSKAKQTIDVAQRLEAEQLLDNLGYWTGSIDGNFDSASRHALTAFQKVEGRNRTGRLTTAELAALRSATKPLPLHGEFAHVEVDLQRQVLFVVGSNGSVTHILPVSTGNEQSYLDHGQVHRAHTPRGEFQVYRQIRGWRVSSLGMLYYPSYIHEGVAIHGSLSVPAYPASHGCIRVPMYAARELSDLMQVGTPVIVYDS